MWFLLRMIFWLGIVLILLPSVGSQPLLKSHVSTSEALWAAKVVAADIEHFCERQREACVVGSQATVTLGQRAQVGAKMLYEFLSEQFGSNESKPTPSTVPVPIPPARPPPQTLRPADLVPPWHLQPTDPPREKQPGEGRTKTISFFGNS